MENNSNYLQHVNRWWWGKSITIVHKKGFGLIEVQFDNDIPNIAYIKGLSVFEYMRKKGIGTELLQLAEEISQKHETKFLRLSVDKTKDWLVQWYTNKGYITTGVDEHEFLMTKTV